MSCERHFVVQIERIINSGVKTSLAVTGGGSGAVHALLSTPGASRFVADVRIPYSPEALEGFLGEKVEHSCSPATAIKMAIASGKWQVAGGKRLSVSCTAALQTDRKRRGDDRAFICMKTAETEKVYALYFSEAPRVEQEALLSDWLLVLIAQAVGAERNLILPGSFNPVHKGHLGMLKAAETITGLRGVFELSAANVDKPELPEEEVLRRASVIRDIPVALTRSPRFTQKAQLFPNTTFVLGHDTAVRLVDPVYCVKTPREGTRPTEEKCRPGTLAGCWVDMWELFQSLETKFLVAGRQLRCGTESFQGLEDLSLPTGFESLFEAIPEEIFREDISSTELRENI